MSNNFKAFWKVYITAIQSFLSSSDSQFGFKPGLSCSHAIYSIRKVVDHYINGGSTVNTCIIYLSKSFDKMNHSTLFLKLIKRKIPINLLRIIEYWFRNSFTCVRWGSQYSQFYKQLTDVSQGEALSPCLFAIVIDDLANTFRLLAKAAILVLHVLALFYMLMILFC